MLLDSSNLVKVAVDGRPGMDEAETYQQRLQAIAERRRQQEEEKKLRRETEEEWLKTAQKKAGTDGDVQEHIEAEDHFSVLMAQRMFHESGQDGRSVLGTVAVQVERDPKTGATVVRSVAPVSAPAGAPMATTVFDDGRKSIHAVGGVGGQPSTEELGQILSVIDGVGMKVLLDEVTISPNRAETKIENADANRAPEGKVLSFSTHHAMSEEGSTQLDISRSYDMKAELGIEDCAASMGNKDDKQEDRSTLVLRDVAGEVVNVEDPSLEDGPVTLVFLGYADSTDDQGQDQEDQGMLTVERVIITDDGEELVVGPETSASPQAEKESQDQEVFQDVPLEGDGAAGVKAQPEEGDKGLHNSSLPTIGEGGGTSKRKTCKCCSVM
ncbi:hypothetical protein D9C73_025352 [Collichthys lucidus]|uniref:Palmdelphin n=1 Tax=Collichthys lucidus TaxID=240159 RepID=A0A4U5VUM8_COLLU|nr:hypothetical protein D9C73_025352 [Collichthys lucidus]